MEETVHACEDFIEHHEAVQHVVLNAGKVVLMQDDEALRRIVRHCDLVSADGQSVVWAGQLLGIPVPERVTGIDLMERLLADCEARDWPVYFLGATEPVLKSFTAVVRRRYPYLPIVGIHDGYFSDDREAALDVAASGARVLFVAMPSPRKEHFLAEQHDTLGPIFSMGVGGSFDVWAGLTRRAPVWMRDVGLEWLFRLLQEPRRMFKRYLVGNVRFVQLVFREWQVRRTATFGATPANAGHGGPVAIPAEHRTMR
jgi:N-acetylglucosaminyldiphosphoundecaprenol N-acetyl-beta-D-mannosaminyltransferase